MEQTYDELYHEFFARSPIGCGISDEAGRLVDFNDAMLRYSGFSREDIFKIGSVTELYYDGAKERERLLGIARERGGIEREEVRFKKKDGSWFWTLMSLRRVSSGGKNYWLAVIEDITGRKKAEAEREQYVRDLERLTKMMAAREVKMIELKEKIGHLEKKKRV